MNTLLSRIALTAADTGLAVAPLAAQSNTRAGDSRAATSQSAGSTTTTAQSGEARPGRGRGDDDGERFVGTPLLIGLLAAAGATGVAVAVSEEDVDDDDQQSPGT
jgi:hypothetical protein